MKLILDTQAFLWFFVGDVRLSAKARAMIEDAGNDKLISIVSLWKIAIKSSLGKLPLAQPFEQLIPEQLRRNGFEVLGVTVEHVVKLTSLSFHHRDPFDRMLVAQSLAEGVPLVSSDEMLDAYGIQRSW